MLDLSRCSSFEWDEGNRDKIWKKHGVSMAECEELFFNQPLIVADDVEHSASESRYTALGRTRAGRFLFCVFTLRGDRLRVVTCRPMNRAERSTHEQA